MKLGAKTKLIAYVTAVGVAGCQFFQPSTSLTSSFEIGCWVISSWVLFGFIRLLTDVPSWYESMLLGCVFLVFFLFQKHPDEQVPYATLQWINIAQWKPATSNKTWNIYIYGATSFSMSEYSRLSVVLKACWIPDEIMLCEISGNA